MILALQGVHMELKLDTTDVVAWWGAVVATSVLVWDIYKWKTSGARLRMRVSTGMVMTGNSFWNTDSPDKRHIVVNLSNYGDRSTTLTHLCFHSYPNWYARLRNRPQNSFVAANPNPSQPLPHELKNGNIWMGITDQTPDFVGYAKDGFLEAEVTHSHSTKTIKRRVVFRQSTE